jgi:hypothetical protein
MSKPEYRLRLVCDATLSGDRTNPGRLAERDAEYRCRLFPGKHFCPSRTFAWLPSHQEEDRRHSALFGAAIEFTPFRARSPSPFPASAASNVQNFRDR